MLQHLGDISTLRPKTALTFNNVIGVNSFKLLDEPYLVKTIQ